MKPECSVFLLLSQTTVSAATRMVSQLGWSRGMATTGPGEMRNSSWLARIGWRARACAINGSRR